jgi:hypothetical protein
VSWKNNLNRGGFLCKVRIPNLEIRGLYRSFIQDWLNENPQMNQLVEAGFSKNYGIFFESIQLLLQSRYHTALFARQEDSVEEVYHSFLLFALNQDTNQPRYAILPEEPTGTGRADVLLVDHLLRRILAIEVKRTTDVKDLKKTAQEALTQAKDRNYGHLPNYHKRKYQVMPAIGIAFCAQAMVMKVQGLRKIYQKF